MKQKSIINGNEMLSRQGDSLPCRSGILGVQSVRENSNQIISTGNQIKCSETSTRNSSQDGIPNSILLGFNIQKPEQNKGIQQPHHGGSKSLDQQAFKRMGGVSGEIQKLKKDQATEQILVRQHKIASFSQPQTEQYTSSPPLTSFSIKQHSHHAQSSSSMSVQQYLNANNYQRKALQLSNKLHHNDLQFLAKTHYPSEMMGGYSAKYQQFTDQSSSGPYSYSKLNDQCSINPYFQNYKQKQPFKNEQMIDDNYLTSCLKLQEINFNNPKVKYDAKDSGFIKKSSMISEQAITTCDIDNSINMRAETSINYKGDHHLVDASLNLRESINQKIDSSVNQRVDLSTFSRDTSALFPELNARDQAIIKQRNIEGEQQLNADNNKDIINSEKSYIIDNLSKDMSVNFSKVEEISIFSEQEIEKEDEKFQNQRDAMIKGFKKSAETNQINFSEEITKLKDENKRLRIEAALAEEKSFKYEEDMKAQMKVKEEEIKKLQKSIDELQAAFVSCQKLYSDIKSSAQEDNKIDRKMKNNKSMMKLNDGFLETVENKVLLLKPKSIECNEDSLILKEIMTEFNIEKSRDVIPKLKQVLDKDMIKLLECLTDMLQSFAPKGCLESQPSIKQIWKWLKNLFKEYVGLKQQQNEEQCIISQLLLDIKVKRKEDIHSQVTQLLSHSEQLNRVIKQVKQYFQLPVQSTNCQVEMSLQNLLKSLYPNQQNQQVSSLKSTPNNQSNSLSHKSNIDNNKANLERENLLSYQQSIFKESFKNIKNREDLSCKQQLNNANKNTINKNSNSNNYNINSNTNHSNNNYSHNNNLSSPDINFKTQPKSFN